MPKCSALHGMSLILNTRKVDGHIIVDEAIPNPRNAERELAELPEIVEEEEAVA